MEHGSFWHEYSEHPLREEGLKFPEAVTTVATTVVAMTFIALLWSTPSRVRSQFAKGPICLPSVFRISTEAAK